MLQCGRPSPSHPAEGRQCDVPESGTFGAGRGSQTPWSCSLLRPAVIGRCRRICLHVDQRTAQPSRRRVGIRRAEYVEHPGSASPCPATARAGRHADSPWGIFFVRRGPHGFTHSEQNFLGVGGGVQGTVRNAHRKRGRAQSCTGFRRYRPRFFARFCHNSAAVLRL